MNGHKKPLSYDKIIRIDPSVAFLFSDRPGVCFLHRKWQAPSPDLDPSRSLSFRAGLNTLLHPELDDENFRQYMLNDVKKWRHQKQYGSGRITGREVYDDLKARNMLGKCLGVRDGDAILREGITTFRRFFGTDTVLLWRTPVVDWRGGIHVPFIAELKDNAGKCEVIGGYYPLENPLDRRDVTVYLDG